MWWQVGIIAIVAFVLISARSNKAWDEEWLATIFKFIGFKKGDKLDPTEQVTHFCFGSIAFYFLRLLEGIT